MARSAFQTGVTGSGLRPGGASSHGQEPWACRSSLSAHAAAARGQYEVPEVGRDRRWGRQVADAALEQLRLPGPGDLAVERVDHVGKDRLKADVVAPLRAPSLQPSP